jgi:hypothetical protein
MATHRLLGTIPSGAVSGPSLGRGAVDKQLPGLIERQLIPGDDHELCHGGRFDHAGWNSVAEGIEVGPCPPDSPADEAGIH